LSFHPCVQTGCEVHPVPYTIAKGGFSRNVKLLACEVNDSPVPSYVSVELYHLYSLEFHEIKDRENFYQKILNYTCIRKAFTSSTSFFY
jgi:hypothetical protein